MFATGRVMMPELRHNVCLWQSDDATDPLLLLLLLLLLFAGMALACRAAC
jgi:hypothetical protein